MSLRRLSVLYRSSVHVRFRILLLDSSNTGPSEAKCGSMYVYAETSFPNSYNTFTMSKNFSTDYVTAIQFSYFMKGAEITDLYLQGSHDGGENWVNLWSKSGEVQDETTDDWGSALVIPSSYFYDRIRFDYTADGYLGDVALDCIELVTTDQDSVTQYPTISPVPTLSPTNEPTVLSNPCYLLQMSDTYVVVRQYDGAESQ